MKDDRQIYLYMCVCVCVCVCIGVGAGTFVVVQRIYCQNFRRFAQKCLCDKRSPYKFSAAVGSIYFPLPNCYRLENIKFDT